jgi:hypothetical protein
LKKRQDTPGSAEIQLRQLIDWGLIPVMRIGRKILIRVETLDLFVEKNNGKDLRDRDSLIGVA